MSGKQNDGLSIEGSVELEYPYSHSSSYFVWHVYLFSELEIFPQQIDGPALERVSVPVLVYGCHRFVGAPWGNWNARCLLGAGPNEVCRSLVYRLNARCDSCPSVSSKAQANHGNQRFLHASVLCCTSVRLAPNIRLSEKMASNLLSVYILQLGRHAPAYIEARRAARMKLATTRRIGR